MYITQMFMQEKWLGMFWGIGECRGICGNNSIPDFDLDDNIDSEHDD